MNTKAAAKREAERAQKIAEIVDAMGPLADACARKAKYDALRKQLLAVAGEWDAVEERTFHGTSFVARVSARQTERKVVGLPKLLTRLGKLRFFSICSITVKALESVLPGEETAEFLASGATGARVTTVTRRADLRTE